MKLYFANMGSAKGLEEYLKYDIDILSAFPSFPKTKDWEKTPFCDNLFVDSGAFGKYGDEVNLEDYCSFLKDNSEKIDLYANLDVIGDAEASWKNQLAVEENGFNPLPVFHLGSDFKWLYKMIEKYDYIALGGLVPFAKDKHTMYSYLDPIWEVILDEKEDLKVHGFGVNNIKLMKRYPWYSLDASSVHVLARFGGIYTPWEIIKINPEVNFDEAKWQLPTHKPIGLKRVGKFATKHLKEGITFEQARQQSTEGTLARCSISIHYMHSIMDDYEWNGISDRKTKPINLL